MPALPTSRFAKLSTLLPSEDALESVQMSDFTGLAFMALRGHDALSQCFEFDITAISGTPNISADKLLGTDVGLTLIADAENPDNKRFFHGMVDGFRFAGSDSEGNWLYHLLLRPRLWLLSKASDNRIFQGMSVKEIVNKVLDQHSCSDYEWNLNGSLPPRDYCVQYGESDLDFVQRLLEHEGIFYYFRFEEGTHRLVFCDSLESLKPAPDDGTLLFREGKAGQAARGGAISRFSRVDRIVSGSHSLTDYDFKRPSADLMTRSENTQLHSDRARYSYPGYYIQHGRGDALAKIRNREDQAHAHVISALSTAAGPASGNSFTLQEFPRESENDSYAIERVEYDIRTNRYRSRGQGARTAEVDARFVSMQDSQSREADSAGFAALYTLVPQSASYKPRRLTPRPVMKGPQTAVVVGPSGQEIYTDEYARVKVQFHWDRKGQRDEHTTCFIRVSSAWGGSNWGFIQIPRIGQEVIVDFLEGDPDQPIITGRFYNAEQMPPYGLPGNATQSGWKSNSSPGGGGWNELRFEDKKGSEEVYFQAEKDHNELVKNNEARHIGNDFSEEVVHDATQWVGHDRTETVDNNKSTTVGVDRTVSIGNNDDETVGNNRSLTVGTNETISVGSNSTETIGVNHSQTVGSNQTIVVGTARSDTVGAAETRVVGAAQTMTIGAARAVAVGAEQQHVIAADDGWSIGSNQTISVGADRSLSIGENSTLSVGKSSSQSIGEDLAVTAGKNIVIEAGDSIVLKCGSATISMKKDGTITIDGKDISTTGSGKINVKASSDVTIKGSKINQN